MFRNRHRPGFGAGVIAGAASLLLAAMACSPTPAGADPAIEFIQHAPAANGVFSYPWRSAGAQIREAVARAAPIDGKYQVDETATIAVAPLPFYKDVELVYVKGKLWNPHNLFIYFAIDEDRNLWRLTGVSGPIHAINAAHPPVMTVHTVRDYLWFFTFFVRADGGPFLVVETPTDVFVPRKVDEETRKLFEKNIKPIRLIRQNADGSFGLEAIVYYANAIFSAKFTVQKSGSVEMTDDMPLAQNLPVMIDAPLQ